MSRFGKTTILAVSACVALSLAAEAGANKPGVLIVPTLLTKREMAGQPGFVPPKVWIYDEVGQLLRSSKSLGAYDVGERISLPEGWYMVEVANIRHRRNRAKMFVKSRRVTIVPTGLIAINVEPASQQPRDVCKRWSGRLFVSLPLAPNPGPVVATNRDADPGPVGVVQVLAGYYHIQWNQFFIGMDVKPNMALNLPTGHVGPMPQKKYTFHARKGHAADNPGLRLCLKRTTRVLARTYWGTYNKQISAYPFKERVWEQVTVDLPESKGGPYQKMRRQKIRGAIFTGPGSEPTLLWEQEEQKLPDAPPPPTKDEEVVPGKSELIPTPSP